MENFENFTVENKLMYDLIFSDNQEHEISILEYISNIKEVNTFIDKVVKNLKIAGIKIKEDILILTEKKNIWILKIEK